jgi:preprotein translocase subunit SecA
VTETFINLNQEYRKTTIPKEKKFLTGFDGIINGIYGFFYKNFLVSFVLRKKANKILSLSHKMKELSDEDIDKKLYECRRVVRFNKTDEVLDEALALIVEVSHRVLGMRPYDVQIMGVLAQQKGFLIEMMPGEGKTITAAIWAVMAGWTGKPCHIVTSNDYLASRDAMSLKEFYQRCHLSVGYVVSTFDEMQRREAYMNDIVYATSKELLADFLRDSMKAKDIDFDKYLINKLSFSSFGVQKVMRGLGIAIVDEADSVLADEAITPLIISIASDNEMLKKATLISKDIVDTLQKDVDYKVDLKFRDVELTKEFEEKFQKLFSNLPPIFKSKHRREFLIKQALMAKEFYHNNSEYIIKDKKIVIVDEKTGRSMEGRSWSAGLHQAIEAKENLELSDPTVIHTKMSFQRFFRLYEKISGMSGTLQKLQNELWHIYKLPTIKIPKRVKNRYELRKPLIYATKEEKFQAVIDEIIKIHETKRPILVGTKDIKESEKLSNALKKHNIESTVLNALHDEEEAAIVYKAGYYASIVTKNL